jgi:two-component system sensor histidine kinase YesM
MNVLGTLSIRAKWITALVTAIVLTGGLIGMTTYTNWANSAKEDAIQLSLQSLAGKQNYMDAYLSERIRTIQTIWFNENVQDFIASPDSLNALAKNAVSDLMSHELYTKSDLIAIMLYDADSKTTIYSAFNKVLDRTKPLQFPFTFPDDTLPKMIPPHAQNYFINGEQVFSIVQGVTLAGRKNPHCYIIMDIAVQAVQNLMNDPASVHSGYYFIVDGNGQYFYHPDGVSNGQTFVDRGTVQQEPKQRGYRIISQGRDKSLLTYVRSGAADLTYYASIPYDTLLANVARNGNFTLLIIVVAIVLSSLIASYVSYRMTKPLIDLKQMMAKVETGDFSVQLPTELRDEVGYLTLSFNRMVSKLDLLTREVYLSKISETEAALQQLQAQINPHFLYNTLDSIHSIATVEGIPAIAKIASSLSALFRYSISSGERLSPIREEIQYVKVYLDIQRLRFQDRMEAFVFVEPELEEAKLLKFIIQPIVENAFHHGLEPKTSPGRVWITVKREGESGLIRVFDDGVGMTEEQLAQLHSMFAEIDADIQGFRFEGGNFGLINVHRRLRLNYGERYSVKLDSELGQGTSVEIRLQGLAMTQADVNIQ